MWGGAKTHRTLSAHRCGATALCSKTRGSAVEEFGGVPYPTVVDHRPSVARPSGETGRPAARERRRVISVTPIRLYIRVPGVFAWRSCSSGRRNRAGNANRNLGPIKNEPQTDASLGEVVAGDVGERVVELGNSGDAVLHVSKVRACCGASAVLEMVVDNPRRPRVGVAYLSQRSCGDSPHPVSMPGRKASVSEACLRLSAERLPCISPRAYYPLFLI